MSWAQDVRRLVPIFTCCQGNTEVPAGECFVSWYTELFHRTLCLKRSELEEGGVPIALKSSLGASNSGMFAAPPPPPHLSSLILSWDRVPLGEVFLILCTLSFSTPLSPKLSSSTPSCCSGMKWNAFCSFFFSSGKRITYVFQKLSKIWTQQLISPHLLCLRHEPRQGRYYLQTLARLSALSELTEDIWAIIPLTDCTLFCRTPTGGLIACNLLRPSKR